MEKIKKNEGITLIALIVTIIVLIILAGISIGEGTSLIKKAKVENFITNMITIRANSKVYAEEINAKTWNLNDNGESRNKLFEADYGMKRESEALNSAQISALDFESDEYDCYSVTETTLENMGLESIKDDTNYVVVYKSDDYTKLDIVYKKGITYNGETYYTLSTLQNAM